jgi:hypothetical protein
MYIYIYICFLNDVDTTRLRTGFRYMKELLLQSHNLRMYKDHQLLMNHHIYVYSVKADAFTIDADKLELANHYLILIMVLVLGDDLT